MNDELYQELLDLGAPKLPENRYYYFWINKNDDGRYGYLYLKIKERRPWYLLDKTICTWHWYDDTNWREPWKYVYTTWDMVSLAKTAYADMLKKDQETEKLDQAKNISKFLRKKLP